MADVITPLETVTFTVTKVPPRVAERKTILRLMQMQPDVQRGLKRRARKRARFDNRRTLHAGRPWIVRPRATKLAEVEAGETFTLTLTPQIIPDVRSVERYLEPKKA